MLRSAPAAEASSRTSCFGTAASRRSWWTVQRTTYRFEGNTAVRAGTRQVRYHAADPVLRREMPKLFEPDAFFADCHR